MLEVVDVLVRGAEFTERYSTQRIPLKPGDYCLVESDIGIQIARVTGSPQIMKKRFLGKNEYLPKVIRRASEEDLKHVEKLQKIEQEARYYCLECISRRGIKMKLIRVLFAFDQSKALFVFTADGRVDFRELVRDLASRFKTRIEMKQIGVRDEARILGGIGNCGFPLCCKLFLRTFHPVSIKMAKDQGLSLIPSKISGLCGRLMCCLQYEHKDYAEQLAKLPRVGKRVKTPDGIGRVTQLNILSGKVFVELENKEMKVYPYSQVEQVQSQNRKEKKK